MCVDISHLVLKALGNTNNQVVDESADCAESSDVLAGTVVQLDVDDILLGVREVDCQMAQVLGEFAYVSFSLDMFLRSSAQNVGLVCTSWSFDGDLAGFDGDLDCKKNILSVFILFWASLLSTVAISCILSVAPSSSFAGLELDVLTTLGDR
jgi:hypothetical protein